GIGQNGEESPWEALAADAGLQAGTSAVSAMLLRTSEFVDNRHTQDAEQVLWDIADTVSRTGALIFRDTSCGVVLCPEHAQMLANAGYSKADVKAWLVERSGRLESDLRRAGKDLVSGNVRSAGPDPAAAASHEAGGDPFSRILPSPDHVVVVVAGARNAAISMVVRTFGVW